MERRSFIGSFFAGVAAIFVGKKVEAAPTLPPAYQKGSLPIKPLLEKFDLDPKEVNKEFLRIRESRTYTDVWKMFDDIAKHTKETGDCIIVADSVRSTQENSLIGFAGVRMNQVWGCSLANVKRCLDEAEMDEGPDLWDGRHAPVPKRIKAGILREYLRTSEGRKRLAMSFPGQKHVVSASCGSGCFFCETNTH